MTRAWGAVILAVTLALTACTSSDPLAEQYRDGTGENYISGDGAVTILAQDSRGEPVSFGGPLDVGGVFDSADVAGSVMVVNFWYAGCPPCRLEAPDLQAVSEQFADQGVVFVGVNILDQAPTALTFAEEFGVTYPSIMDVTDGSVRLAFAGSVSPNAVPTTLVLDTEGRVAGRISGLLRDREILVSMIEGVLEEEAS